MSAIKGGATTAPAAVPAFTTPMTVERSSGGNHSAITLVAAGNPPPSPEWNIVRDPAGARALLQSGVPVFMMPLDSTQIRLAQPALATLLAHGSPLTDQLTLLYHQWSGDGAWQTPTLYDPVAASYVLRPDLCPVTPMHIDVDEQGFTRPVAGAPPNAQVCLKADVSAFEQFLMHRVLADAMH